MKLSDLASRIGAELIGRDRRITGVAALDEASPQDVSIYADPRYARALKATRAGAVVLGERRSDLEAAQLLHPDPMLALCDLLDIFHPPSRRPVGIHPTAVVSPRAQVADSVWLGPNVVVQDGARIATGVVIEAGCFIGSHVIIGNDTTLHPHVMLLDRVQIGRRVIIHAGTVVGADGYGYRWDGQRHRKVPQVGTVRIEDDVEIGAHCTIDRATLGETVIGAGTKLDNQVHIGHNVRVGRHGLIIAQVGIAGSAVLGDRVTLAGQSGVADHAVIGDGAVVVARSGVHGRVAPGAVVAGSPIMPHTLWRKVSAALHRLPGIVRTVRRLEQDVLALRGTSSSRSEAPSASAGAEGVRGSDAGESG